MSSVVRDDSLLSIHRYRPEYTALRNNNAACWKAGRDLETAEANLVAQRQAIEAVLWRELQARANERKALILEEKNAKKESALLTPKIKDLQAEIQALKQRLQEEESAHEAALPKLAADLQLKQAAEAAVFEERACVSTDAREPDIETLAEIEEAQIAVTTEHRVAFVGAVQAVGQLTVSLLGDNRALEERLAGLQAEEAAEQTLHDANMKAISEQIEAISKRLRFQAERLSQLRDSVPLACQICKKVMPVDPKGLS